MDAATKSEASGLHSALRYKFIALVGNEYVRAATAADAVAGAQPKLVIEPGTERELAEILRLSNEAGLAVIPRGGGTKLGWGNSPARADVILSTARMTEIIEHAWGDLTVTVEAGCTVQRLQETLGQHGQRLALDALWPEKATVGGVLCTNDSGAFRLRFGALRDLIIGVTLALPYGTLASSGGKVVKNVAGYDLPKLATGALGTLGVITRAVFRLHPLPRHRRTLTIAARDTQEAQRVVHALQDSKLAHSALQARLSVDAAPEVDILFEGIEAGVAAQQVQVAELIAPLAANTATPSVWNARQELYAPVDAGDERGAIAKISTLPSSIAATAEAAARIAAAQKLRWSAVLQATGVGCLRFAGNAQALHTALQSLRQHLENDGGSLVLQRTPPEMPALDAWGNPGDAFSLMSAVKLQFDPKSTLNPGRFVGGI